MAPTEKHPGEGLVSVAQLITFLEQDPELRKEFAKEPASFLKRHGFSESTLETHHGAAALSKAQTVLDRAELGADETVATALPKLSRAAQDVFGPDYRVDIEPFAVSFLERPELLSFRWTFTGRIRCTWDGWDGCSIGLDW